MFPAGFPGSSNTLGKLNIVVLRSTQKWKPPPGVTVAKITVVDGGNGSGVSGTTAYAFPGVGGNASTSVRALDPAATYSAIVGAGGAASSNTGTPSGGASSFSGPGLTTLTSANGDIVVAGGPTMAVNTSSNLTGGASLLSLSPPFNSGTAATGIGQGAPSVPAASPTGLAGGAGAVIIEY